MHTHQNWLRLDSEESSNAMPSLPELVEQVNRAAASGQISPTAAQNIIAWLTEPRYAEYADEVAAHITAGKWQILDDVFWTVIPFGTGGRRGRMYPIGSNAINDRTIGESAQGLADYVKDTLGAGGEPSCAIAYDTRHRSQHFARLCAEIMTAAGFTRVLPRRLSQHAGALVHRALQKVLLRHHGYRQPQPAQRQRGESVLVDRRANPAAARQRHHPARDDHAGHSASQLRRDARRRPNHSLPGQKSMPKFQQAVLTQATPGPRNLKVIYSPLHGVGATAVVPVLDADGFTQVEVFGPHAKPDGDFPNVPGHVANPENAQVFDAIIERAKSTGADLALATDPDCDRIGCAAPSDACHARKGAALAARSTAISSAPCWPTSYLRTAAQKAISARSTSLCKRL